MGPSDKRALCLSTNGRLDNPRSTGSDTGAVRPMDHRDSGAEPRITGDPRMAEFRGEAPKQRLPPHNSPRKDGAPRVIWRWDLPTDAPGTTTRR